MKQHEFKNHVYMFVIDLAGVLTIYLTKIQVGSRGKKTRKLPPRPLMLRAFISYCRNWSLLYYKRTAYATNGNESWRGEKLLA